MKRSILKIVCVASLVLVGYSRGYSQKANVYSPAEGSIEDNRVYETLLSAGRDLIERGKVVSVSKLSGQLERSVAQVLLKKSAKRPLATPVLYNEVKKGVLIIATIYKCSHCPNDHVRAASGFVIHEDGIAVTSYHIFRGNATDENSDLTHVVMDYEGNVYPIVEVLAAHQGDDIAIFKINTDGRKLIPLPLGQNPSIGEQVTVVAHPHSMFYSLTQGDVSRFYIRDGGEKMSITADFGQGSSGGPVFDNKGNVVGVVSATLSLYNSDNNLQMVSKETIPVERLKAIIIK